MEQHNRKMGSASVKRIAGMALLAVFSIVCTVFIMWVCLGWQGDNAGNVNHGRGNVTVDGGSEEADDGDDLSGRQVYFAGFEDSVFGEKTRLELKNPEENGDFYMSYRVIDAATGETYYESDLIGSGRVICWKPADVLAEGIYDLSIQMMPYYSPDGGETWTPLTSTSNSVTFTILHSNVGKEDGSAGNLTDPQ